jgi:hypothetical protein
VTAGAVQRYPQSGARTGEQVSDWVQHGLHATDGKPGAPMHRCPVGQHVWRSMVVRDESSLAPGSDALQLARHMAKTSATTARAARKERNFMVGDGVSLAQNVSTCVVIAVVIVDLLGVAIAPLDGGEI